MKKIIFTLFCLAMYIPSFAITDALLSFYQRESITKGKTTRQDRMFAAALAQDVAQWLQAHPQHAETKQALLMKADYEQRAGQKDRALIAWYQVRFLFPDAQDMVLLSANVDQMMDQINHRQKAQALQLLTVDTAALSTQQQRQAALLTNLVKSNLEEVYLPVNELFEQYFTQYPQDAQLDKMILLYGDWHRQNRNYHAAVLEYKKVHELFPNTVYKAASLRMMADVYAADLRDYETAVALYDQVLKQYPDSTEIGIVYKHMAVMEENRKNYDEALVYYDKAIADLGDKPTAYEAWQGKTDVLLKTKEYQAAYDTLIKGSKVFAKEEKKYVDFYIQAAEIAQRRLKNLPLQAAALSKVLMDYPQNQHAPELMYQLGESYEKQAKTGDAIITYKWLILQFPTDKWASRAQGRLNRLEKSE